MDIRLGDILSAAGFLGGGFGVIIAMRVTIARLAERQTAIENTVKTVVLSNSANVSKIATALTRMARYDERIRYLRRDVEELRRKEGYIRHPSPLQASEIDDGPLDTDDTPEDR